MHNLAGREVVSLCVYLDLYGFYRQGSNLDELPDQFGSDSSPPEIRMSSDDEDVANALNVRVEILEEVRQSNKITSLQASLITKLSLYLSSWGALWQVSCYHHSENA